MLHPDEIAQEEGWIAAARRDPQAFAPLYELYHKPIFLFILKRVQDRDLCSDLTAQVFLKSMAALPKYEGRGLPFKAWLYRIALNEVLMHFRRHKGRQYMDIDAPQAATLINNAVDQGDDDRSLDPELMERLTMVLARLQPVQALLIELRFFDGLSFQEVGHVLGIAEAAAKMRTHRVLGVLRKTLVPGGRDQKNISGKPLADGEENP
ncbi:MAG: sigma-70 family RNA polymerase sigma factor [Flavobacteriales bacterium]